MPNILKFPGSEDLDRNRLSNETTDTLKTPQAYGIPTLDRMYGMFYDEFFSRYHLAKMPQKVPFTFSNAKDYLGKFHCKVHFLKDRDNRIGRLDLENPSIELSNAYDLTPVQLGNVIAHEMIHLFLVAFYSEETTDPVMFEGMDERGVMEEYLSHGWHFKEVADKINKAMGTEVTVTNDLPLVDNGGRSNSRGKPVDYVFVMAPGMASLSCKDKSTLIGLPTDYIPQYLAEHPEDRDSTYVYRSVDNNFNAQFGPSDERHGKRTTIPTSMIYDYQKKGILQDVTVEYIPEYGEPDPDSEPEPESDEERDARMEKLIDSLTDEQARSILQALFGAPEEKLGEIRDNIIKFPKS